MITGSRDFADEALVDKVITDLVNDCHRAGDKLIIVHGACPTGADKFADTVAKKLQARGHNIVIEAYPANWSMFGASAGPRRNAAMFERPTLRCIAFWDGHSTGTLNTIQQAVGRRVLVVIRPAGSSYP